MSGQEYRPRRCFPQASTEPDARIRTLSAQSCAHRARPVPSSHTPTPHRPRGPHTRSAATPNPGSSRSTVASVGAGTAFQNHPDGRSNSPDSSVLVTRIAGMTSEDSDTWRINRKPLIVAVHQLRIGRHRPGQRRTVIGTIERSDVGGAVTIFDARAVADPCTGRPARVIVSGRAVLTARSGAVGSLDL